MKDEDLEVTAGCVAAHPDRVGGQHVAKTCTAVRILHRPSGIAVTSVGCRSQYGNRETALDCLRKIMETWPNLAKS